MECQDTDGAMYSFPKITMPPAFIEEARSQGKEPDVLYCLELLNETGLSCVPGGGFQQKAGTFHIRTTILPAENVFADIVNRFKTFHQNLVQSMAVASEREASIECLCSNSDESSRYIIYISIVRVLES